MSSTIRPLLLAAIIIAIIVVAGFASLLILDIIPRDDLQESFIKTILVLAVMTVAIMGIWATTKLVKKDLSKNAKQSNLSNS